NQLFWLRLTNRPVHLSALADRIAFIFLKGEYVSSEIWRTFGSNQLFDRLFYRLMCILFVVGFINPEK
ncbi:hypothetical protein, partial [Phocaeicola sp.]|uniref:hypothetical protein n=1 Tax=Phocaeicola sp. TaxID=2773926 RepID=UPI003A8D6771